MTARSLLLACAISIGAPAAARAQDWTVDLGLASIARPLHLGSKGYMTEVVPIVGATLGDRFSFSLDDGAKWTAWRAGPMSAGPVAEYRRTYDDDLPPGAFRMDDAVEIGGFVAAKTPVGIAEARLRHAVNAYDGWSADLSFDTGGRVARKLQLGGEVRASWADADFTQEYFGLEPHVARRFGLPRFLDDNYISVGAQVMGAYDLAPHRQLVFAFSDDRIVGEVGPSPILKTRDVLSASVGFVYHWSSTAPGHLP